MPSTEQKKQHSKSAFDKCGFDMTVDPLLDEIRDLYRSDAIPWVIGYSGGKDSTAVLQLVWYALQKLDPKELTKPVYVITTDTLVENPIVATWVANSLELVNEAATDQGLPITSHRLTPKLEDSFWVNLIGRGYPAPRPRFRWCTERLKINPSNDFINSVVQQHGEAIILLGTRKAESAQRAHTMKRHEKNRVRDRLNTNSYMPNALIFSPIEDWTNDNVWEYLSMVKNPWSNSNFDLMKIYRGATPDNECPLVLDSDTPSCGDSRFGCWVCTMVDKDRSMQAMIQNDADKEWMEPLLALRDKFAPKDENGKWDDRHLRDFRRMNGMVQLFKDRHIPGPYKQHVRQDWLRELFQVQSLIRKKGPEHVRNIDLISLDELEEIRRIWVVEKHEIEDSLPALYEQATGDKYPGRGIDDNAVFRAAEMTILKDICQGDELHYQLVRELLSLEKKYKSMLRRVGLFGAIDKAFQRSFYKDEADAVDRARKLRDAGDANDSLLEQLTDPQISQGTGDDLFELAASEAAK